MRIIDIPNEDLVGSKNKVWNGGLASTYGKIWLSYRYEPTAHRWPTELGIAELDRNTLQVVPKSPRKLRISRTSAKVQTIDDARLLEIKGRLYAIHAQGLLLQGGRWVSSVCMALLDRNCNSGPVRAFKYGNNINLSNTGKEIATEKNWSPFAFGERLRMLYTINPLVCIEWDGVRIMEVNKQSMVDVPWWKWGHFFAGGSPLIRRGDEYIGICHTFINDNPDKPGYRKYFGAPFAISAETPHRLTRFAREPMLVPEHDDAHDLRPDRAMAWRPNVVYPMGLLDHNGKVYVSYGWQDCRIKLLETSWEEIDRLLHPVGAGSASVPVPALPEPQPHVEEGQAPQEAPKALPEAVLGPVEDGLRKEFHQMLTPMPGWWTPKSALALYREVARVKPMLCVDLGVFGGRSMVSIAHSAKKLGLETMVIGIDAWDKEAAVEAIQEPDHRDWWSKVNYEDIYQSCLRFIRAYNLQDSCAVIRGRSEKLFSIFGTGTIDLLHIDGNPHDDIALRDASFYMPLVRPGGTILFSHINCTSDRMKDYLDMHCVKISSEPMDDGGVFTVFEKNSPEKFIAGAEFCPIPEEKKKYECWGGGGSQAADPETLDIERFRAKDYKPENPFRPAAERKAPKKPKKKKKKNARL